MSNNTTQPTPEPCPACAGQTVITQLDNGEKAQVCTQCGATTCFSCGLRPIEWLEHYCQECWEQVCEDDYALTLSC